MVINERTEQAKASTGENSSQTDKGQSQSRTMDNFSEQLSIGQQLSTLTISSTLDRAALNCSESQFP